MHYLLIVFFLLLPSPAIAQWGGAANAVNIINPQIQPPPGSPGLPAVDDSYATQSRAGICAEYGHQVPCTNHYAITRASVKYCQNVSLIWRSIATGMAAICNTGVLPEDTRTNTALWARDMTNAAWAKVGITAALDATGIDGTANSASTLTATGTAGSCAASCTALQTLVIGSTAENYSVWLKRVTGSGAVNITLNNLVGATACTLGTTEFTRCTVTATLANPVIGVQMTTVGDIVIADFNQLEAGVFPTSPILTTTVSAARAADVMTASGALLNVLNTGVATINMAIGAYPGTAVGGTPVLYAWASGSFNVVAAGSSSTARARQAATNIASTVGNWTAARKVAFGYDAGTRSISGAGGAVGTDSLVVGASGAATLGGNAGTLSINTPFSRFTVFATRLPDGTLQMLSSP